MEHDDVEACAWWFETGGEIHVGIVPDDFDDDYFGDETLDDDELGVGCICCDLFFSLPLIVQHRDSQHLLHILQQDVVQTEKKKKIIVLPRISSLIDQ